MPHVFVELDGSRKSPDAFATPIGQKLDSNVSQWPVVAFKSIPNSHFPMMFLKTLAQTYIMDIGFFGL